MPEENEGSLGSMLERIPVASIAGIALPQSQ